MMRASLPVWQFSRDQGAVDGALDSLLRYLEEVCALAQLDHQRESAVFNTFQAVLTAIWHDPDPTLFVECRAILSSGNVSFTLHVPNTTSIPADLGEMEVEQNERGTQYTIHCARLSAMMSLREAERLTDYMANIVLPLGLALSSETDFDRLLERILLEAKRICRADAGTLYLRDGNMLHFTIIMTDSLGIHLGGSSPKPVTFPSLRMYDETGSPNIHNVASYVALTGQSINVPDMYRTDGFDFSAARRFDEQNHYRSVSNLTVPFKDSTGEVVGVLQLLNASSEDGRIVEFGKTDQLMVEILTAQAAVAINTRLLWQKQEQLIRLQNDLQVARVIQNNFIPNKLPQAEGWEIGGRFQPARDVSGDFYDLFTLSDGRIVVVVGDVCDKGVGAALFMTLSRSLLRAFMTQAPTSSPFLDLDIDPAEQRAYSIRSAVSSTNAYIAQHHEESNMFTTLFIGAIDPAAGLLTYLNGGHCPAVVIGRDGTLKHRLKATGAAVGMFANTRFEVREIPLDPGDLLFCFTDGLTDARAADDRLFGETALIEMLRQPAATIDELLNRVISTLNDFISDATQFDDITMAAIRRA